MIIRVMQTPFFVRVTNAARCPACGKQRAVVTRYYRDPDYHELLGTLTDCSAGCAHKQTIDEKGASVTFIMNGPPEKTLIDDENKPTFE